MQIPCRRVGWGLRPGICHQLPGKGGADDVTLTTPEQPGSEDLPDSRSELVGGLGRLAPKARKIPEAD